MEKEFNLLFEPWILARDKNGIICKLSILEAFRRADQLKGLAGETGSQDIAILRLLLAIMHGSLASGIESADEAKDFWKELWDNKAFATEAYNKIETYLSVYEERFYLFHPETPFYQVSSLLEDMASFKAAKGKKVTGEEKAKSIARLIGEIFQSDNRQRLFAGRTGSAQKALEYDEAARWLIHLNAFDDDSAKNPTPKGVGYLGKLGLVYIIGNNLFETLLLNFVLADERKEGFDNNSGDAYWEKPVCRIIENLIIQPRSQKDLLTMQSRRILLKREGDKVIGYWLTMGDYFDEDKGLTNEQMTLWKIEKNVIKPKQHKINRQIWRDFSSLICEGNSERVSGVIAWMKSLQCLKGSRYAICIIGVFYEWNNGWQVVDFIEDSLRLNASILQGVDNEWYRQIIEILKNTEEAVNQLGEFSKEVLLASGGTNEKIADEYYKEKAYSRLDKAFREWLIKLNPEEDDFEEKTSEWYSIVKAALIALQKEILNNCSDKALVGKNVESTHNVFKASLFFGAKLKEILG